MGDTRKFEAHVRAHSMIKAFQINGNSAAYNKELRKRLTMSRGRSNDLER